MRTRNSVAVWLLVASSLASSTWAQLPQVADSRLGVDRVELTSGQKLYGFVLDRSPQGNTNLAVERTWLEATYPELASEYQNQENKDAIEAREQLLKRVDAWIDERADNARFQRFLQVEKESIAEADIPQDKSFFILINLSAQDIRNLSLQPTDRRHIAGIAYQHRLKNIVTTPTAILARQLNEQQIAPTSEQVDLSADLPKMRTQSDRQWAARQALVEYQLLTAIEYQGTGNQLFRKGEEVDAGTLIGQLLGTSGADAISQLGAELGLPEFQPPGERSDWWQSVTRQVEREGFRGVLITRLDQKLLSNQVVVTAFFFAKQSPGKWFLVKSFRAESDASQQSDQQLLQLRENPQIGSVLKTLDTLGLGKPDQLEQALKHGAATQAALNDVQGRFIKFLEPHIRSLSAPPVPIESGAQGL